ncbi:hypothetical protein ACR56S_03885 [Staphylococcus hominis]|uniref:hypothetical protein n=1 Tax=Staphylococcus hominis TaxID=1290 RepID=UPI003DA0BA03
MFKFHETESRFKDGILAMIYSQNWVTWLIMIIGVFVLALAIYMTVKQIRERNTAKVIGFFFGLSVLLIAFYISVVCTYLFGDIGRYEGTMEVEKVANYKDNQVILVAKDSPATSKYVLLLDKKEVAKESIKKDSKVYIKTVPMLRQKQDVVVFDGKDKHIEWHKKG